MDAYKRSVLDKELEDCCRTYTSEMRSVLEIGGVKLGDGDLREEMARQVLYALDGFRAAIIKALE